MSFRIDGSQSHRESPQPSRQNFDLRKRMLRWYMLFAGLLLTAALIIAAFMKGRLEEEIKTDLLNRVQAVASQLDASSFDASNYHGSPIT